MHTMVQDADTDYDIDDGVYFRKDRLVGPQGGEMSALAVRQMICDAPAGRSLQQGTQRCSRTACGSSTTKVFTSTYQPIGASKARIPGPARRATVTSWRVPTGKHRTQRRSPSGSRTATRPTVSTLTTMRVSLPRRQAPQDLCAQPVIVEEPDRDRLHTHQARRRVFRRLR